MKNNIYIYIFIIITVIIIITIITNINNKINISENNKKNYIFAYGSLTNYYVQKVLLKSIKKKPPKATLKKEAGYARYWLEGKNNSVTLNLLQTNYPKDVNGIIIELDDEELEEFDKYEIQENNHIKKKIDWNFIEFNKNYDRNRPLYIYIIDEEPIRADISKKIPNLYAFTVMEGFNRYGQDYLDLFLSNTK
jgi:hypothetical protein